MDEPDSLPAHRRNSDKAFWCDRRRGLKSPPMSETAAEPAPSPPTAPAQEPSLPDLFVTFTLISVCGFGGVLAWSRRMLVEQRKWMTSDEFNDAYALCQFLPGP